MTLTKRQKQVLKNATQLEKCGAQEWTPYRAGAGMQTIWALERLGEIVRTDPLTPLGRVSAPRTSLLYRRVNKS